MSLLRFVSCVILLAGVAPTAFGQIGTGAGGPVIVIDLEDPASYSIDDATVELGEEFQLTINISTDEELALSTIMLEVDPEQIHITDWAPGAALQDYLDENGDIPCDAFLTCDALDVFMAFLVEFDPDEWGTEFIVVDCLVVAEEEGDAVATVTNVTSDESDDATITFEGGVAIDEIPECTESGFPFPAGEDTATYSVSDVTTELGEAFDLIVTIETDEATSLSTVLVEVDSDQIQITDWSPGAALQDYLDENGPIPCDVIQTCSTLDVFMVLPEDFDAEEWGDEYVVVECLAVAAEEGDTTVTVTNTWTWESSEGTVTFEGGVALDETPECEDGFTPFPTLDEEVPVFTLDDTVAEVGGEFEMVVNASADDTVTSIAVQLSSDEDDLEITDVIHGAGLDAYVEDNGLVLGELFSRTALGTFYLVAFDEPVDLELYGTDLIRIVGDVNAEEAGAATIDLETRDGVVVTGTVTIAEVGTSDLQMLRGDPNADGDCTIIDALVMLEYLFLDGSLSCNDAADFDDSGTVGLTDPLALLTALFIDDEPLEESCESDDTADALTCDESGC